jgi:hypothetical protein
MPDPVAAELVGAKEYIASLEAALQAASEAALEAAKSVAPPAPDTEHRLRGLARRLAGR